MYFAVEYFTQKYKTMTLRSKMTLDDFIFSFFLFHILVVCANGTENYGATTFLIIAVISFIVSAFNYVFLYCDNDYVQMAKNSLSFFVFIITSSVSAMIWYAMYDYSNVVTLSFSFLVGSLWALFAYTCINDEI